MVVIFNDSSHVRPVRSLRLRSLSGETPDSSFQINVHFKEAFNYVSTDMFQNAVEAVHVILKSAHQDVRT